MSSAADGRTPRRGQAQRPRQHVDSTGHPLSRKLREAFAPISVLFRPNTWNFVLLVAIALTALSCASQDVVELASNVPFIQDRELDVIGPVDPGAPLPAVVLLHGAGLQRSDYRDLAESIAERGAVVFNADWRVLPATQNGGLEDAACAVRYARNHASEYGADPDRIVLIGHSTGGVFAGRIGTDGDSFAGDCTEPGSALPNALVIISPAQVPGGPPWPHSSLGGNPDMPIAIIHGVSDTVVSDRLSDRTAAVLGAAGYSVTLLKIAGGHFDVVMVDPPDGEPIERRAKEIYAEPVIDEVFAIADLIGRR